MNFHAMEQDNRNSHEITSFDVDKVLQANIIYLKKKRKSQAQQEGLPLSKHKCLDRNLNSGSQSNETLINNNFEIHKLKGKAAIEFTDTDESELESVEDSNSFNEDTMDYSTTSVSNEAKTISEISKSTTDKTASSSVTCSVEKNNYRNNNFGLHACMNYDEVLLELGCSMDSSASVENESTGFVQCKEKEIEEMLYSNGMPKNYVLSSGKWSFNQDNQGGAKKLTIDKEFEEYFSMLML